MRLNLKKPLTEQAEGLFVLNDAGDNNTEPALKTRLVGLVNYRGTAYQGVQKQWHPNTVQSKMEQAFEQLQLEPKGLFFSGRTDSGVHAIGQVFHLDVNQAAFERLKLPIESINALLPTDISIPHIAVDASGGFHATVMAQSRRYKYCIYNNRTPNCWLPDNALWVPKPLDFDQLQAASRYLLGEHDFSSFQCMKREVKTKIISPICHVITAEWSITPSTIETTPELLCFEIEANRFIYKMVRSIVGTLIKIGHSELPPEAIQDILESRNRQKAGISAPARGLTMMGARYPREFEHLFV